MIIKKETVSVSFFCGLKGSIVAIEIIGIIDTIEAIGAIGTIEAIEGYRELWGL
jgi:hypothetical protein